MTFKQFLKHIVPVSYHKYDKQGKLIKKQENAIKSLERSQNKLLARIEELEKEQKSMAKTVAANDKRSRDAFSKAKSVKFWVDEKNRIEKHDYYKEIPKELYIQELSDWFMQTTGEKLDLEHPVTYNQKIQWLKIFDSTPIKTRLADKYLVRSWVADKIGEKYLTKIFGVWDNFDDIDFDALPDKFVLKATHGCKFNYIVKDKAEMNRSDARFKFRKWMKINYAYRWGLEPQYKGIKPRIIAEEYLENETDDLYDYKIWCFNGEPKYIQFLSERNTAGLKMAFYDAEWNRQEFVDNPPRQNNEVEKPGNLDEMLETAAVLAKDFCHVRVDLYRMNNGEIKFGEMTFTPASGACKWDPPEYNKILGDMITLPKKSETL